LDEGEGNRCVSRRWIPIIPTASTVSYATAMFGSRIVDTQFAAAFIPLLPDPIASLQAIAISFPPFEIIDTGACVASIFATRVGFCSINALSFTTFGRVLSSTQSHV